MKIFVLCVAATIPLYIEGARRRPYRALAYAPLDNALAKAAPVEEPSYEITGKEGWRPYEFSYTAPAGENGDSSHSRQESFDGQGNVKGSYTITLADGRTRTVQYTADETGFHAQVITNELGTETSNPADVQIQSEVLEKAQEKLRAASSFLHVLTEDPNARDGIYFQEPPPPKLRRRSLSF